MVSFSGGVQCVVAGNDAGLSAIQGGCILLDQRGGDSLAGRELQKSGVSRF